MIVGNVLVKYGRSLIATNGSAMAAIEYARRHYGADHPATRLLQKAAIVAGDLAADAGWQGAQDEFLRGVAVGDPLQRLAQIYPVRQVPLATRVLGEVAPVASWTDEGAIMAITSAAFQGLRLIPKKVTSVVALTTEAAKAIGDAGERELERMLEQAVADALASAEFCDPAAPITGAPLSLLAGAPSIPGTGDIAADLSALLNIFPGNIESAALVTGSDFAVRLALAQVGGCNSAIGPRGGQLLGFPLIASSTVTDGLIVLIDATQVAVAQGNVELDIASEALVEIDGELSSAWQNDLIALSARCYRSWVGTSKSVAYLKGAIAPVATSARITKSRGAS